MSQLLFSTLNHTDAFSKHKQDFGFIFHGYFSLSYSAPSIAKNHYIPKSQHYDFVSVKLW